MPYKFWIFTVAVGMGIALHPFKGFAQDELMDEPVMIDTSSDSAPVEEIPVPTEEVPAVQQDEAKPEEPEPTPAPIVEESVMEPVPTKVDRVPRYARRPTEERLFGSYDLTLSMARPTFTEIREKYEIFYGKPSDYFSIGVDWFPLDFYATLGLGFKASFYSDRGYTSNRKLSETDDASTVQINENSSASLLAAPLQIVAKIQMTPFPKKWIKLSGWAGLERVYWQEKKLSRDDSQSTSSSGSTSSSSSKDENQLVTSGHKDGIVIGAAAHFLLNFFDEKSIYSMHRTIGFGYVYLTPYFEMIKGRETGGLDFSRNVIGLGFTFETLR